MVTVVTAREAVAILLHLSNACQEGCSPCPVCASIINLLRIYNTWPGFLVLILIFSVYSLTFHKQLLEGQQPKNSSQNGKGNRHKIMFLKV